MRNIRNIGVPTRLRAAIMAALMMGMAGCGSMGGMASPQPASSSPDAATPSAAPAAKISEADQKMLIDIAHSNLAEIQTGRLALSKSQNPQVREFAQRMIDDHTTAMQSLQRLAQAKGVTLPTDTDFKHKAIATELGVLSGGAFDRQYLSQVGVTDHKNTYDLLMQTSRNATDPELRAYALKFLPIVSGHLDSAQRATGKS
jgi:putative membrane protein